MDYRRRAEIYRRSLAAAGASQSKPRLWRLWRLGPASSAADLRLGLGVWTVVVLIGLGGLATRSRWGLTIGVIALLIGIRQLTRVMRWRRGRRGAAG